MYFLVGQTFSFLTIMICFLDVNEKLQAISVQNVMMHKLRRPLYVDCTKISQNVRNVRFLNIDEHNDVIWFR